jgi:hypothetical protein
MNGHHVSSNPWTTTEWLADRNTSDIPQCLVLSCSGPAEQVWTEATVATNDRLVVWHVCREHYLDLTAGDPWEAVSGGPRSFRRWLLMGDQLNTWPRPFPSRRPRVAP